MSDLSEDKLKRFFERAGPYVEELSDFARRMLLERQELTHQTAIGAGHGWRLAAIIYKLRKRGWPIFTYKDGRGIAHYRLAAGWYPGKENPHKAGNQGGGE